MRRITILLGVEKALVVLLGELGVYGEPDRIAISPVTSRQPYCKFDPLAAASSGGDILRVLIDS